MDQVTKLLLDTAQSLFADGCETDIQKAAEEGVLPKELWQAIEDNGLTQALVPEASGGVDVGLPTACAVLRVAGAFALPLPLADTMLSAAALAHAGFEVPTGTLALASGNLTVNDGQMSGTAVAIPWLPAADHIVLVATGSEGTGTFVSLATRSKLEQAIVASKDPAGEPIGDLDLSKSADVSLLVNQCTLSADWIFHTAAVMRVSLIAGALDRVLDLCIDHATTRVQFGRAVAKFQAVQNLIAILAGETAAIGVSAPAAVDSWNTAEDRFSVACAKTRASEAAGRASRIAHQVHAAIGYTEEHILHRFTRRLWSWRDQYGDETYWSERVGSETQLVGGDGLWPRLTQNG